MTCIIGLVEDGKVYIGGDSCGFTPNFKYIRKDRKVFTLDIPQTSGTVHKMLVGGAGSFRCGQLMQYSFTPPKHNNMSDAPRYLCSKFMDGLRRCLIGGGYLSDGPHEIDDTFVIGYQGNLYRIWGDFQLDIPDSYYTATGSGENHAMGALKAMDGLYIDPERKITKALKIAAHFCADVAPPFIVESV